MRIVLGVGGGIAAYKVASLLRLFTEAGHDVTVIPTEAATRFVGVATWEALSGHPVSNSVFDAVHTVNHVRLGHEAELIVVAPATADLLARAATGQADDLLTNTLLMAGDCPVLMAPAMHTEMWQHPATAGQRRNPAQPRRHRAGTRERPADRRRLRSRPAARARGDLHRRHGPRRRTPCYGGGAGRTGRGAGREHGPVRQRRRRRSGPWPGSP